MYHPIADEYTCTIIVWEFEEVSEQEPVVHWRQFCVTRARQSYLTPSSKGEK